MDVTLKTEVTSLSEVVVVVGYTSKRKKDLTGAVSIVNTEQMQQLPTTQLTVQMQGRASNVMILGSEQPGNPKPFANRYYISKQQYRK